MVYCRGWGTQDTLPLCCSSRPRAKGVCLLCTFQSSSLVVSYTISSVCSCVLWSGAGENGLWHRVWTRSWVSLLIFVSLSCEHGSRGTGRHWLGLSGHCWGPGVYSLFSTKHLYSWVSFHIPVPHRALEMASGGQRPSLPFLRFCPGTQSLLAHIFSWLSLGRPIHSPRASFHGGTSNGNSQNFVNSLSSECLMEVWTHCHDV